MRFEGQKTILTGHKDLDELIEWIEEAWDDGRDFIIAFTSGGDGTIRDTSNAEDEQDIKDRPQLIFRRTEGA